MGIKGSLNTQQLEKSKKISRTVKFLLAAIILITASGLVIAFWWLPSREAKQQPTKEGDQKVIEVVDPAARTHDPDGFMGLPDPEYIEKHPDEDFGGSQP